ncbi:hypothetical protein FN846DRAFT_894155 [Sphaerosporella brunnea]|uniref:Uncharacterized protein n=1 Tax=Sphaerosporella brunnea TaxID=1250544 RepID=A0A5J5EI91_9PEZI|nr:hypothetical protein FN846DRAFT_894155 [Sphaerosporella brunnea]
MYDDCCAYVLLINTLLHPLSMKSFISTIINSGNGLESKHLKHLWCKLMDSNTGGRYVNAAAQEVLNNMPTALVVLGQCPDPAWMHPNEPHLAMTCSHSTLESDGTAGDRESGCGNGDWAPRTMREGRLTMSRRTARKDRVVRVQKTWREPKARMTPRPEMDSTSDNKST